MASRLRLPSLVLALLGLSLGAARAETEVDLALVLAVDVSRSMDPEEQELQRQGFVEAFRSSVVHEAIKGGMLGRIAVTYMEWSGETEQRVVVPWTVVEDGAGAVGFADRLAEVPPGRIFQTSISGAIDFSLKLLATSGVTPLREVIDISGDGPNSSGRLVTLARDAAVARGVTINGLPIMLKRPTGFGDMEHLDRYYRDCVIGGVGAFTVPVRERQHFADAIKTKIIREIAGFAPAPRIIPAQAEPAIDCATRQGGGYYWRNQGP
ncbi:MAG TPA: DUF1194 domain-containing protein [Microvirga sp.]|jgi:hypothetical protein